MLTLKGATLNTKEEEKVKFTSLDLFYEVYSMVINMQGLTPK